MAHMEQALFRQVRRQTGSTMPSGSDDEARRSPPVNYWQARPRLRPHCSQHPILRNDSWHSTSNLPTTGTARAIPQSPHALHTPMAGAAPRTSTVSNPPTPVAPDHRTHAMSRPRTCRGGGNAGVSGRP
jgi:hypothetical protein